MAMHGNKSQRQREVALARFESGSIDTLVATDVAARGIDVSGISHVINFDPPHDHDTYVHRVGRTGRAGRSGVGITLVEHHERRELSLMADRLGIEHGLGGAARPAHAQPRSPSNTPPNTRSNTPSHTPPRPARRRRRSGQPRQHERRGAR
jgi:superfamily II DNA/RNA helicase